MAETPAAPDVTEPVAARAPEAAPALVPLALPEAEAPIPEIAAAPEAEPAPEAPAMHEPAAAPAAAETPEAAEPEATTEAASTPEAADAAPAPAKVPEPAPAPELLATAPEATPTAAEPQAEPAALPTSAAAADEMVAAAQELSDESVVMRQVTNAGWDVVLPFETTAVGDADAFPMISRVLERADRPAENDWIAEGVTIYAINDTFVSDQAAIGRVLSGSAEFGVDHFLFASARIKAEAEGEFEAVTLAARTRLSVDLANGVSFVTEPGDGRWQTVITAVATPEENGLRVGDVVLAELVSGEDLASSRTLEFAINRLARAHRPVAVLAVERNGQSTVARMTLAREN
jgi:Meckel syndrome type 1 protein